MIMTEVVNKLSKTEAMIEISIPEAEENSGSLIDPPPKRPAAQDDFRTKFKTEMCKNFLDTGECAYMHRCTFAHGPNEMRKKTHVGTKYKTRPCRRFISTGWCPYGSRCLFIHNSSAEIDEEVGPLIPQDLMLILGGDADMTLPVRSPRHAVKGLANGVTASSPIGFGMATEGSTVCGDTPAVRNSVSMRSPAPFTSPTSAGGSGSPFSVSPATNLRTNLSSTGNNMNCVKTASSSRQASVETDDISTSNNGKDSKVNNKNSKSANINNCELVVDAPSSPAQPLNEYTTEDSPNVVVPVFDHQKLSLPFETHHLITVTTADKVLMSSSRHSVLEQVDQAAENESEPSSNAETATKQQQPRKPVSGPRLSAFAVRSGAAEPGVLSVSPMRNAASPVFATPPLPAAPSPSLHSTQIPAPAAYGATHQAQHGSSYVRGGRMTMFEPSSSAAHAVNMQQRHSMMMSTALSNSAVDNGGIFGEGFQRFFAGNERQTSTAGEGSVAGDGYSLPPVSPPTGHGGVVRGGYASHVTSPVPIQHCTPHATHYETPMATPLPDPQFAPPAGYRYSNANMNASLFHHNATSASCSNGVSQQHQMTPPPGMNAYSCYRSSLVTQGDPRASIHVANSQVSPAPIQCRTSISNTPTMTPLAGGFVAAAANSILLPRESLTYNGANHHNSTPIYGSSPVFGVGVGSVINNSATNSLLMHGHAEYAPPTQMDFSPRVANDL